MKKVPVLSLVSLVIFCSHFTYAQNVTDIDHPNLNPKSEIMNPNLLPDMFRPPVRNPGPRRPPLPPEEHRPPVDRPETGGANKLSPIHIAPETVEIIRKGSAIVHKPFEIRDPATGNGSEESATIISPTTMLTLSNGKQIQAGTYYKELNEFESFVNQYGFTVRTRGEDKIELHRLKLDSANLEKQAAKALTEHDPLKVFVRLPVDTLKANHLKEISRLAIIKKDINLYRGGIGGRPRKTPKIFHADKTWNASWGSTNNFAAFVTTNIVVDGTSQVTKSNAQGSAGGYLFGQKLEIVHATTSLSTPVTGVLVGDTSFYFLGMKILSKDYNNSNPLFFSTGWSKGLDVSSTIHFTLGPIPMSAKIGANGESGLEFRMDILALHANADITPNLKTNVYVQVGVDVLIGGAGAGGSLVLINDTFPIVGRLQLLTDNVGPYFYADLIADEDLTALAGKLYVYVWIEVPRWGIPPWEKKEWDWTLFNFGGIHANGNLYSWQDRLNLY